MPVCSKPSPHAELNAHTYKSTDFHAAQCQQVDRAETQLNFFGKLTHLPTSRGCYSCSISGIPRASNSNLHLPLLPLIPPNCIARALLSESNTVRVFSWPSMNAVLAVSRKLLLAQQEVAHQQHASVADPINGPHEVAASSSTGGMDASGGAHVRSGLVGLFVNGCLLSAVVAFALAQISKVFTHYYVEKNWDWTRLVGSGGG